MGPRAAGHVGVREPGRAWAQRPGVAPASSGPRQARGADLPPSRPRDSNFLLGPRAGLFGLLRPQGQTRAGHRGHLRSPNPDPGDGARALPERRRWLWVRGEGGPYVLKLAAVVLPTRSKTFLHIKKKEEEGEETVPSCCLDLAGAIFKALSWVGAAGLAGQARCGLVRGPENQLPGLALRPSAAGSPRHPDARSLDTWGSRPSTTAPGLDSLPVTRSVGAGFMEECQRLRGRRALSPELPSPQTLLSLPRCRPLVLQVPGVWAGLSL